MRKLNGLSSIVAFMAAAALGTNAFGQDAAKTDDYPQLGALISTGDNYWAGEALPFDSEAAIEDSFDFMKELGVKQIYWRGVQDLAYIDTMHQRPDSPRYFKFMEWVKQLHKELDPEKRVVEAAHKRGMKIWGMGTLQDWGATADTPAFADYPYNVESNLRLEHPEWVPTDRYGIFKQGGNISFAYPEARKILADLHVGYMKKYGYDGLSFLTYNENHSMRFQDEFGYTEASVKEFKDRYKIDVRTEEFARFGSRQDWLLMHGRHTTEYLREIKKELAKTNQELSICLNPTDLHAPLPWSTAPELIWTAAPMYMDLETWVQEGIVDDFTVFGNCDRDSQLKALSDTKWLTRDTDVTVSITTSQPHDPRWKGAELAVVAFSDEESYFDQSPIPVQPMTSLKSDKPILVMKALAQIVRGEKAQTADVIPLASHKNIIVRRLALRAIGVLQDPSGIPTLEKGLEDPERTVRFAAVLALGHNHRIESAPLVLAAAEKTEVHPMIEAIRATLPSYGPAVKPAVIHTIQNSKSIYARAAAMTVMVAHASNEDLPVLLAGLKDADTYVRFSAAMAMARLDSTEAIEAMIAALENEDPVVSNRIATSIGSAVAQSKPNALALRAKALDALKKLYAKLGDGTKRADAEWGYRPVGDALLVFGDEGRAVLQSFMDQTKDVRLSEQAWKNLYIKRAWNSFSEIDQSQNAQAMRIRPQSLKTLEVARMSNNFDHASFTPAMLGMAGDAATKLGRWGEFAANSTISAEHSHSAPNSLKLVRGGLPVSGYVVPGIKADNDYQLRAWIRRSSADSALLINVTTFTGTWMPQMAANVAPNGELQLLDMKTNKLVGTSLILPANEWVEVRLLASRQTRTYTASVIHSDGTVKKAETPVEFTPINGSEYMVQFSPQQPETNHATYIDDVQFIETP